VLVRIFTIAMNAYREAVRARVLFGLFAVAIATIAYSLVVATLSLHQEARVVADIGAASMSLYAVLVAVVVIATSLHREVELKTIFPILSRPVRRHEFLLGKYAGVLTTLGAFLAVDAGAVLLLLAAESGQKPWKIIVAVLLLGTALAVLLVRAKYTRVFILIPWAFAFLAVAYYLADTAQLDRQLVVASAGLAFFEVSVVSSVAMLFASFSSPFLTVIFTVLLVIIGRSADSLVWPESSQTCKSSSPSARSCSARSKASRFSRMSRARRVSRCSTRWCSSH
jgi:Cu-processing system permease protein